MKSIWLQMRVNKGRRGNILTRVEDLEVKQRQKIFHNTSIVRVSDLTDDLGEIVAGRFTALGAGATETEPTGTGFIGSFMDGDGVEFSDGTVLNVGSAKNGNYAAGFNNDGDFVAAGGDVVINENGISAGGRVAIDENGFLLDGGENIFMDSADFTGVISLASGGFTNMGTGANGAIYAIAKDGSGNIYVGGEFTQIGGVAAKRFAKYDGASWSKCGIGIGDGAVRAIAIVGTDVYVGGTFTKTINVTVEESGGVGIYVPPSSSEAFVTLNYLAKYDGTKLNQVVNGSTVGANNSIYALAANGTTLYAGGDFTAMLGTAATRVASIDTTLSTASALSTGLDATVYGLVYSTDLYACGAFTSKVRKYSGGAWAAHGSSLPNDTCYAIAKSGNDVYVAGAFTSPASYIGKCTSGGAWGAVGSGLPGTGYSVAIDGTNIIAGYDGAEYVKYYNGSSWLSLGSGVNGVVRAVLVDTTWVLGGFFTTANGSVTYRIVRYSASSQPETISLQTALEIIDAHQHYSVMGGHANGSVPLSSTVIATLFRSGVSTAANESQFYVPMPAGTMKNLRVYTDSAHSGTGSLVATIRKNGSDTTLVATVTAGAGVGVFSDTTNTVSFSAGDKVTLELTNNATASSAEVRGWTVEFSTRN